MSKVEQEPWTTSAGIGRYWQEVQRTRFGYHKGQRGVDFNNAGGRLLFNHLSGIGSDGTHLLLADRYNNRVLVWNSLPTGNQEPDLALGQPDLTSNNPGTGRDRLNWPGQVAVTSDGRVAVADTENHRIHATLSTRTGLMGLPQQEVSL